MSLSVERLKELLAYETEWLAMFDHAALVRGMADLETRAAALHRDAAKAYSELLAIKEAPPVAWAKFAETGLVKYWIPKPPPLMGGNQFDGLVPIIRKPE